MDLKQITPDAALWEWGLLKLNLTIIHTWIVMAILVLGSWLATRKLSSDARISSRQNLLEALVEGLAAQIEEIAGRDPRRYLPFIGTLFIFIAFSNCLTAVPGLIAPTSSLSTGVALAICVLVAVPIYGIWSEGIGGYLKQYLRPTPLMLPFHVIGEASRTLALAVRLFGNVMSGAKIGAVLLAIVPLFFPVLMQLLGLLTGLIQAYIFAVLAMVYIASATQVRQPESSAPVEIDSAALVKGESFDG
ncbi:MAG: F0F1 ATP synthase subunit A [Planctomycetales bacterium]